jgi:hypothetical protein
LLLAAYQSRYIPQLHYFNRIISSDVFVILDDVQYSRGDLINRTLIDGSRFLTVPVITKKELANQILIDMVNFNIITGSAVIERYLALELFKLNS